MDTKTEDIEMAAVPFDPPDVSLLGKQRTARSYGSDEVRKYMRAHEALTLDEAIRCFLLWRANGRRPDGDGEFRREVCERVGCSDGTLRYIEAQVDRALIEPGGAVDYVLGKINAIECHPVICGDRLFGYRETLKCGRPAGIFECSGDCGDLMDWYYPESGALDPCDSSDPFGVEAYAAAVELCTDNEFFDPDRRPPGVNLMNGYLASVAGLPLLRPHHPRWRATHVTLLSYGRGGLAELVENAELIMAPTALASFVDDLRKTFPRDPFSSACNEEQS